MGEAIRKKEGDTTIVGHEEVYESGPPDRDKDKTLERVEKAVKNARIMNVDDGTIIPADKADGESWSQGRGESENSLQATPAPADEEESVSQGVTPSPPEESSSTPSEEGASESLKLREVPVGQLWSVLCEKVGEDQLLGLMKRDCPELLEGYLDQMSIEDFISAKLEPFKVRFEIEGFGKIGCRYSLFKPMQPENVENASSVALLLGYRSSRGDEVFVPDPNTPFRMVVGCDCNDAQTLEKVQRIGSVFDFDTLGYSFMLMTADLEVEREKKNGRSPHGRINTEGSVQEMGFYSQNV